MWNNGEFALCPVYESPDHTVLVLQFFWQREYEPDGGTVTLSTAPPLIPQCRHHSVGYESRDGNVESGDIITISTPDPERLPLPSYRLLQLQWFLTRIVGLAAAADVDQFEPHSSADETGVPGLVEAGEEAETAYESTDLSDVPVSEQTTAGLLLVAMDVVNNEEVRIIGGPCTLAMAGVD